MGKWVVRTIVWVCLAASFALAETPKANANTFLDWLHGRNTDETIVCYPTYCYDPCVQYDPCNPCATQVVPQGQAVAPNWGTSPMVQPAPPAVNPIPQTYYKTNWEKVPVTRYRPVVYSDPATGYPLTVMDPCTTYTWMPERRRQSFLSRLFHGADPPPAAVIPQATPCAPPCYSPVMSDCGIPAASSCCTPSAPAMGPIGSVTPIPTSPAPYYPSSPPSSPMVPMTPGTSPQGIQTPGAAVVPPAGAQQVPSAQPAVPADVTPRLKPNIVPNKKPAAKSSAMTTIPWGAGRNGAIRRSLAEEPPARVPSSSPQSGTLRLRPVPDPDATSNERRSKSTPVLLNPRDRTARARPVRAGTYSAIAWPSHAALVPTTTHRQATRPVQASRGGDATRYTPAWDDSGWTTIRP